MWQLAQRAIRNRSVYDQFPRWARWLRSAMGDPVLASDAALVAALEAIAREYPDDAAVQRELATYYPKVGRFDDGDRARARLDEILRGTAAQEYGR